MTMARRATILGLVLIAWTVGRAAAVDETVLDRGKRVYGEQRCQACHAIAGQGNRRYPLDGVGGRLDAKALRTWIVAPKEMDPKVRKPAYDKLPDADLDALVAYLASLR